MTTTPETLSQGRCPNAEPIPGYRLLERLGRGGFGEVWKCEAPGGLFKAIKFVDGTGDLLDDSSNAAEEEWHAIELIKAIRHPFLLSLERVERIRGALLLVMELADTNLGEILDQYRKTGHVGLPREELLAYMAEAAEVLDLLNTRHGLQHLDVKPRNLFVVSNHVKVADFGLVSSLGHLQGEGTQTLSLGAITPIYASPEVFRGSVSRQSDQYSLAIVYHELLTGALPFDGKNSRQLMLQHTTWTPNLQRLPASDLVPVARALSKDPEERYPSCLDFIHALRKSGGSVGGAKLHQPPPAPPPPTPPKPSGVRLRKPGDTSTRVGAPAGSDMLPGHRFLKCLERGPLSEVWQVDAPDGASRLVKFLYGFDVRAEGGREALTQLQGLVHPSLVPFEMHRDGPGRLALVTDVPQQTLRDRWQECRNQGAPGLPVQEVREAISTAAEALDALYALYGLPHLALQPRALWWDSGDLRITDFGLVPLLWFPARRAIGQINPRYAAPELSERRLSPQADQYSLALIYQEIFRGTLPHKETSRSLFGGTRTGAFVFDGLSGDEMEVLSQALQDDPQKRYANCQEFADALACAEPGQET